MAQASRHRINVQHAGETLCINLHLLELHTFTHIMDELEPLLKLTPYQRSHTRIYLQSKVGETEVLVSSRPHYATTRGIDYVGIPANPTPHMSRFQRRGRLWLCLFLLTLLALQAVSVLLVIELVILKPRAVRSARDARASEVQGLQAAIGGPVAGLGTVAPVMDPAAGGQGAIAGQQAVATLPSTLQQQPSVAGNGAAATPPVSGQLTNQQPAASVPAAPVAPPQPQQQAAVQPMSGAPAVLPQQSTTSTPQAASLPMPAMLQPPVNQNVTRIPSAGQQPVSYPLPANTTITTMAKT
ncbi:hypothetical protein BCR37DRAFT_161281 [Protomyces lactucae-debilis]|uniref:Uncharacterized protein n=1 Tax=Protomyces lactucae-debilis TaxID=2754530 RepID=A0A1Y2EZQ4_PROLT|nr:uncharacterized protein BCR37DRAFT_161281 [Protomyces lactucae-debilis]ORY76596.1 hypothetical protein BCR37DRAFT_161281 [Protomyces lactucae-debilis]